MKTRLLLTTLGLSLMAFLVTPIELAAQGQNPRHPHYTVIDLGPMNDTAFSQATFVSNNGVITGLTSAPDFTQHAVLWYKGTDHGHRHAWTRRTEQWSVWRQRKGPG